jgi:hypothetical protein
MIAEQARAESKTDNYVTDQQRIALPRLTWQYMYEDNHWCSPNTTCVAYFTHMSPSLFNYLPSRVTSRARCCSEDAYNIFLQGSIEFLEDCLEDYCYCTADYFPPSLYRLILSYVSSFLTLSPYAMSRYIAVADQPRRDKLCFRYFVHTNILEEECSQSAWQRLSSIDAAKPVHLVCNVPGIAPSMLKQIRERLQQENHPDCTLPAEHYWLMHNLLLSLPDDELVTKFAVYRLDVIHVLEH